MFCIKDLIESMKMGFHDHTYNGSENISDFRKLSKISPEIRIDKFLSTNYNFRSREKWQGCIEKGQVRIKTNNSNELKKVKSNYILKDNNSIWIYYKPLKINFNFICPIIYKDNEVICFMKPGNMVMHTTGMHLDYTFIDYLKKMEYKDTYPVHRIDRETSGIILCANSKSKRKYLSSLFENNIVKKMYIAITKGNKIPNGQIIIDQNITHDENSKIRIKHTTSKNKGSAAITKFITLAEYKDYSLVACFPISGRTNQIRVHLKYLNIWIVGDKVYHPDEQIFIDYYYYGLTNEIQKKILFPRQMLHNTIIYYDYNLIVCPLTKDMLEFPATTKLLSVAGFSIDNQVEKFKKFFLNSMG